jgi:hypothetical protein
MIYFLFLYSDTHTHRRQRQKTGPHNTQTVIIFLTIHKPLLFSSQYTNRYCFPHNTQTVIVFLTIHKPLLFSSQYNKEMVPLNASTCALTQSVHINNLQTLRCNANVTLTFTHTHTHTHTNSLFPSHEKKSGSFNINEELTNS